MNAAKKKKGLQVGREIQARAAEAGLHRGVLAVQTDLPLPSSRLTGFNPGTAAKPSFFYTP